MKLIGYTCTFNEAKMVPYVMPYVKRIGYDKFIVYDNMSTDNTVELLKQYPFVEIRQYDTNGVFDETARSQLHVDCFNESREIGKVGTKDEEDVWMTWTDFDEVFFFYSDVYLTFKDLINNHNERYNCYDCCMANLLPPMDMENTSLSEVLKDGQLVHTINGIRALKWPLEGFKPSIMKVNDFPWIDWLCNGNHFMEVPETDKGLRRIPNEICYSFHLKYIDKNALAERASMKQYQNYYIRRYEDLANQNGIDRVYENLYSLSCDVGYYLSKINLETTRNDLSGFKTKKKGGQ